jgi:hypothetical protein
MSAFNRQFAAAAAQHDNASPDESELLDGQVDASDANDVGTFIAGFADSAATEIFAEWMTSSRDSYADAKYLRQSRELAARIEQGIADHNDTIRPFSPDHDAQELAA